MAENNRFQCQNEILKPWFKHFLLFFTFYNVYNINFYKILSKWYMTLYTNSMYIDHILKANIWFIGSFWL